MMEMWSPTRRRTRRIETVAWGVCGGFCKRGSIAVLDLSGIQRRPNSARFNAAGFFDAQREPVAQPPDYDAMSECLQGTVLERPFESSTGRIP